LEQILESKEFLENQLQKNITASMEVIKNDSELWPEYASDDTRTIKRLQALKESFESPVFTTENYEITNAGKAFLHKHGIKEKKLTRCYGNQLQQAIHKEFVSAVNDAANMQSQYNNEQITELSVNVITFAHAGTTYLKAGFIKQALLTSNFCKSLLDCGYALGESIIHATLHPVETVEQVIEAVDKAGESLCDLLRSAGFDNKNTVEKYFPDLDPDDKKAMIEFWDKFQQEACNHTKKLVLFEIESLVFGKVLGLAGEFFKVARSKVFDMIQKLASGGQEAAVVLAESVPIHIKIAEKSTKSLLEKATSYAHSSIQYEKLKAALRVKEFTSIIKVTKHGIKRLIERKFTPEEVLACIKSPDFLKIQANGAKAFIKKVGKKYNLIVINEKNGKVISALRMIKLKKIQNLGENYGWKL